MISDSLVESKEYCYYFRWNEKVHFSTSYTEGKRMIYEWKVG